MTKSPITPLPGPSGFSSDPLTDILQTGARQLLKQAVEAELATLLAAHAREVTDDGRARLVRHGHLPEREVMTGIGPIPVKAPRVRDRGNVDEKIRFARIRMPGKSNRQGHFHGRLSGGSWGAVGAERGRAFIEHHLAIESGLGGGV